MEPSVHSARSRGYDGGFGNPSQRSYSQQLINPNNRADFTKLIKAYEGAKDDTEVSQSDHKVDVLPQQAVPLIKVYSDENSKLKQEKALISESMQKLQKISQNLIAENDKITVDMKKIAQTISLNLWQQQNDLKHRIHLYKQQNNLIIRSLNDFQKETLALDSVLSRTQQQRSQINQVINNTQFKILESTARIKDIQNQISNLKKKKNELERQKKDKNQKLDNFVLDNIQLRTFNRDAVLQLKVESQQLGVQKPRIMTQNVRLHGDILELKNSLKGMEEQVNIKQKQIDLLTNSLQKQRTENQQKQNCIQANNSLILTIQDSIKRAQRQIQQSIIRQKQQQSQFTQLTRKKQQLTRILQSVDQQMKGKQRNWSENLKQNKQSKISNNRIIQNNISKKTIAFAHEKATLQYNIKQLKNQIDYVKQQSKDRQQHIYQIKKSGQSVHQYNREISKLQTQIAQQERKIAMATH